MLQFIYSDYAEKLTLKDIATSANISEREALRTFKKTLVKAPFGYLNEYRLSKAKDLLESTDLPITEIAFDTRFSDSAYFEKVFKKIFRLHTKVVQKEFPGKKAELRLSYFLYIEMPFAMMLI